MYYVTVKKKHVGFLLPTHLFGLHIYSVLWISIYTESLHLHIMNQSTYSDVPNNQASWQKYIEPSSYSSLHTDYKKQMVYCCLNNNKIKNKFFNHLRITELRLPLPLLCMHVLDRMKYLGMYAMWTVSWTNWDQQTIIVSKGIGIVLQCVDIASEGSIIFLHLIFYEIFLKFYSKNSRTTDIQWRHKSKRSENLGWCGRQNMLQPYLKIWEWELIFSHAVKMIS